MKENAQQAVLWIIEDEGPEFNKSASEPGGGSKYGVSLTAFREAGHPAATLGDIAGLTKDEAIQFYTDVVLTPIRFDDLPDGVDYRFADIRVNLGQTGAVNLLEMIAQRWPLTGKIDDALVKFCNSVPASGLIMAMSAAWIAKKHESPNWSPSPLTKTGFGHGWSNRNAAATKRALSLA